MYQQRQGDILFTKVGSKDTLFLQLSDDNIVAHGEITGHKHVLQEGQLYTRTQGQRETDDGDNRIGYIMTKQQTEVIHDEHDSIKLDKNSIYEITQQREFSGVQDDLSRYVAPKTTRVRD